MILNFGSRQESSKREIGTLDEKLATLDKEIDDLKCVSRRVDCCFALFDAAWVHLLYSGSTCS